MFRRHFLIGCALIVAGIAWPTVSMVHALTEFSEVYRSAAQNQRGVPPSLQAEVIWSVEHGVASILGGAIIGLFGIGLALKERSTRLERKTDAPSAQ